MLSAVKEKSRRFHQMIEMKSVGFLCFRRVCNIQTEAGLYIHR